MAMIGHLMVSRELEESLLMNCDGSCNYGRKCACLVDLHTKLGGKAFSPLGVCVLCLRRDVTRRYNNSSSHNSILTMYVNMEGDYRECDYLGKGGNVFNGLIGPFIRYNPMHYKLVGENSIDQSAIGRPQNGINWISYLFTIEHGVEVKVPEKWQLVVCKNENCKSDILSFINDQHSDGYGGTKMDVESEMIVCDKCSKSIATIDSLESSSNFVLEYKNTWYSKCGFCGSKVEFNESKCPQSCDSCHSKMRKSAIDSSHCCLRCNSSLNMNRRGGAQKIKLGDSGVVYFCRRHSINKHLTFSSMEELAAYMEKS